MTVLDQVGVYHDTHVTRWQFDQLSRQDLHLPQSNYHVNPEKFEEFKDSSWPIKFATYHVPFPEEISWLERFDLTYQLVKHTFVQCSELHEHTVEQLIKVDRPNVTIFICGFIDHEFKHAKVLQWMDWFVTTAHFYKYDQPQLLEQKLTNNSTAKPKKFDILLGMKRQHRDYVYDYVTTNGLTDQMIMTYFKEFNNPLPDTDFIVEEEGLEFIPDQQIRWTVDGVNYYGKRISLSQIVPFKIYNQTAYSLVAETNFFNHFNFYTEKIVKPLMSKRLFIVISGKHYLKNLRSLGFRTFDGIVDESYDTVDDNATRWQMALEQMTLLTQKDPQEVYQQVNEIVIHNQKMILEKDWQAEMIGQLKNLILDLCQLPVDEGQN